MKKKLQIFISSTFTDLREERKAAVEAVLKAGHIPAGMELFIAGDRTQMETIKRWIEESDIYMLILGGRYGSIEPTTLLSYIELEYDYAITLLKPLFSIVINEDALERKVKAIGKNVLELEQPKELKLFRAKVLSKMSTFFSDIKDIKLAIHETIPDLEARYKPKGWIAGADVPDTQPLVNEISRLTEDNKQLSEQVRELRSKIESKTVVGDDADAFEELTNLLKAITIEGSNFPSDKNKTPKTYSLLDILWSYKERIITGITNEFENWSAGHRGEIPTDRLMFYNICPKLHVHDLVLNEKFGDANLRRWTVTKRGQSFLAYLEKRLIKQQQKRTKG